jgi:hypothetical protein
MTHRFSHAVNDANIARFPEACDFPSFARCIVGRPEGSLPVQYLWRLLFGTGGGTPT